MTPTQRQVLDYLAAQADPVSGDDVDAATGTRGREAFRALDALVTAGLVEYGPPVEGFMYSYRITDKGLAAVE